MCVYVQATGHIRTYRSLHTPGIGTTSRLPGMTRKAMMPDPMIAPHPVSVARRSAIWSPRDSPEHGPRASSGEALPRHSDTDIHILATLSWKKYPGVLGWKKYPGLGCTVPSPRGRCLARHHLCRDGSGSGQEKIGKDWEASFEHSQGGSTLGKRGGQTFRQMHAKAGHAPTMRSASTQCCVVKKPHAGHNRPPASSLPGPCLFEGRDRVDDDLRSGGPESHEGGPRHILAHVEPGTETLEREDEVQGEVTGKGIGKLLWNLRGSEPL